MCFLRFFLNVQKYVPGYVAINTSKIRPKWSLHRYVCIYTYKHGGLYKLTHFVRTIIIVNDKTIGIHIVHTVAGTVDGPANENAAHGRKCTNLTISLHVAENTSLLAICIYICACVTYIYAYVQELYFVL